MQDAQTLVIYVYNQPSWLGRVQFSLSLCNDCVRPLANMVRLSRYSVTANIWDACIVLGLTRIRPMIVATTEASPLKRLSLSGMSGRSMRMCATHTKG